MDVNYFGRYASYLRRKKQLRQKQIAAATGLDASYVAGLETGRRAPPRDAVITKLAGALKACNQEANQLCQAALLTKIARVILEHADKFAGASAALAILEMSHVLSAQELSAIETLVEGYRYRIHAQGRTDM